LRPDYLFYVSAGFVGLLSGWLAVVVALVVVGLARQFVLPPIVRRTRLPRERDG
jgi:hypothetical protein